MKQITEYIQKKHIDNKIGNVDDIYTNPISYDNLLIRAEEKYTIKKFNNANNPKFKTASDFINEFINLWDELPKEKTKITTAELYYQTPDILGFTLYTHNNYQILFWINKKNSWAVSTGNYTYCYNTHKELFEDTLLDL